MHAFSNYIISIVEWNKTYLTFTSGEDSPSYPGGCSGYKIIWDENTKDSAINMNNMIRNHIEIPKKESSPAAIEQNNAPIIPDDEASDS